MINFLAVLLFFLGFVLVVQGGSVLVDACHDISVKFGISHAFMGAGVLSLITTMPEIMVAVFATSKSDYSLAIGNSLGSMICNFGVVLAVSFLLFPTVVNIKDIKNKLIVLSVILIFFVAFIVDGQISLFEGVVLLILFVFYFAFVFYDLKKTHQKDVFVSVKCNIKTWQLVVGFVVGAVSIALGAKQIVDNIAKVGFVFHVNEKFLGLVIVAIGTSLPELVTVMLSAKNGFAEMGIGNMIGANVVNCSFIIGFCRVVNSASDLVVVKNTMTLGCVFLTLISFFVLAPILYFKKTFRIQGLIVLLLYVIYVVVLFMIV